MTHRFPRALASLCSLSLIAVLALGGMVEARSLSKTLSRTGLTQQDIDIMGAAAAPLYTGTNPRVGGTTSWSNPETGAKGTTELLEMQGTCAVLRHLIRAKGVDRTREIKLRRCRTAEGNWILQ